MPWTSVLLFEANPLFEHNFLVFVGRAFGTSYRCTGCGDEFFVLSTGARHEYSAVSVRISDCCFAMAMSVKLRECRRFCFMVVCPPGVVPLRSGSVFWHLSELVFRCIFLCWPLLVDQTQSCRSFWLVSICLAVGLGVDLDVSGFPGSGVSCRVNLCGMCCCVD